MDQTNAQANENVAKNRELVSEISVVERKAQNAALRSDDEMSRVDFDRCRAQAVAFTSSYLTELLGYWLDRSCRSTTLSTVDELARIPPQSNL